MTTKVLMGVHVDMNDTARTDIMREEMTSSTGSAFCPADIMTHDVHIHSMMIASGFSF